LRRSGGSGAGFFFSFQQYLPPYLNPLSMKWRDVYAWTYSGVACLNENSVFNYISLFVVYLLLYFLVCLHMGMKLGFSFWAQNGDWGYSTKCWGECLDLSQIK
jgi:hypothetical protein